MSYRDDVIKGDLPEGLKKARLDYIDGLGEEEW